MTDISVTAASVLPTSSTTIVRGIAGATITAGKVLYLEAATNTWKLADNNDASAEVRQAKGIALNGASAGQPVAVATAGDVTFNAALTAGIAYYLSDTAGGFGPVADVGSGEYVVLIGVAKSTTVLNVNISYPGVAN